jgi:iron-sulfur cluster repair protein YtfE (RIC family)
MTTDTIGNILRAPRFDETLSVNEVLHLHPPTAAVFNAFGVDACCGGDRTIARAAREDGVALESLLAALRWTLTDLEGDA